MSFMASGSCSKPHVGLSCLTLGLLHSETVPRTFLTFVALGLEDSSSGYFVERASTCCSLMISFRPCMFVGNMTEVTLCSSHRLSVVSGGTFAQCVLLVILPVITRLRSWLPGFSNVRVLFLPLESVSISCTGTFRSNIPSLIRFAM